MTSVQRRRRERAVAAARNAALGTGLDATGARVIKDSNNTIVLLPRAGLVAKVATSTLAGRSSEALERELRLGQHLAKQGAPIAPPAGADVAGPHEHLGTLLTFWRYFENHEPPVNGDLLLGGGLRSVQAGLHEVRDSLPTLTDRIDRAAVLFTDARATPGLGVADRRLASRAHRRLQGLVANFDSSHGLHGEPHDGNVLWTEAGPLLIDFEASCSGPVEWDLAYLPDAAHAAFPDRDEALIATLRPAVSFCVAAWCWAQPTRAPEVTQAAEHHLQMLQKSWLARPG